jgi:outer membrane autotransporter protein
MKKTILAVAFLAAFLTSNAQETNSKITFGAKAGLNVSSASVDRGYDTAISSLVGVHIGGFANFKLDEKFAVQPELLFSTQGFNEYDNDGGYIYDDKIKLTYINLPVSFQYTVASKFNVEAGPQVDFLLSGKADGKYYDPMFDETQTQNNVDIKDSLKSVVFGFNIGAGYAITPKLTANVRYHLGLSEADDLEGVKVKNRNFQVGLGYSFN